MWCYTFAEHSLFTLADAEFVAERGGVELELCPLGLRDAVTSWGYWNDS